MRKQHTQKRTNKDISVNKRDDAQFSVQTAANYQKTMLRTRNSYSKPFCRTQLQMPSPCQEQSNQRQSQDYKSTITNNYSR